MELQNYENKPSKKEIWEKLSCIDVSKKIETISFGGRKIRYISWAEAWAIMKNNYPQFKVKYFKPIKFNESWLVKCLVQIDQNIEEELLPVMDKRNKAILNPDSFDLNTAYKRCVTKCFALFGLAHYIYAGEDMPYNLPDYSDSDTLRSDDKNNIVNEADIKKDSETAKQLIVNNISDPDYCDKVINRFNTKYKEDCYKLERQLMLEFFKQKWDWFRMNNRLQDNWEKEDENRLDKIEDKYEYLQS